SLTTLMSLNEVGPPASQYRFLDVAALEWLYGGDGIGGTYGVGTSSAPVIGTLGNDSLQGTGGNDRIFSGPGNDTMEGGAGTDTAVFMGNRSAYSIAHTGA